VEATVNSSQVFQLGVVEASSLLDVTSKPKAPLDLVKQQTAYYEGEGSCLRHDQARYNLAGGDRSAASVYMLAQVDGKASVAQRKMLIPCLQLLIVPTQRRLSGTTAGDTRLVRMNWRSDLLRKPGRYGHKKRKRQVRLAGKAELIMYLDAEWLFPLRLVYGDLG